MAVLAQNVGRMDIELHRGAADGVGVEWLEDCLWEGVKPANLKGELAYFRMYNAADDVLYEQKCTTNDRGCAYVNIPDSAFAEDKWKAQTTGKWKILCQHNGKWVLLGWGNYVML